MAEQLQPTQQAEPVRVIVEEPPQVSPEDRLWNAIYPPQQDKARAPDGKFTSTKPPDAPEVQQTQQAEAQPGQTTAEAQPATDELPAWDEVKEVKLRVPIKNGDQETQEEVTLEELRNGYLRVKDYTQKTMELADQRKQIDSHVLNVATQQRQQYITALQAMQQNLMTAVAPELQGMTPERWTQLANDDPAEFVRKQNRAQQISQAFNGIQQQIVAAQTQQAQLEEQARQRAAQEAIPEIQKRIPDWNNDLYSEILQRGVQTYGIPHEYMSQAFHPGLIEMARDAHIYRKMMENKPAIEKKLQAVPPVLRPGSNAPKQNAGLEKLKQARERAKTDKSLDSVANLFGAMGF